MRQQDLRLLKQLIHIHETIRHLSASGPSRYHRSMAYTTREACFKNGYTSLPVRKQPPLLRQQSEPRYCVEDNTHSRQSSTSSEQDHIDSQDEFLYSSNSELDDSSSSLTFLKRKQWYISSSDLDDSSSSIHALKQRHKFRSRSSSFVYSPICGDGLDGGDAAYDDILKRNVKLWKWGLAHEDAVFNEEPHTQVESFSIR